MTKTEHTDRANRDVLVATHVDAATAERVRQLARAHDRSVSSLLRHAISLLLSRP